MIASSRIIKISVFILTVVLCGSANADPAYFGFDIRGEAVVHSSSIEGLAYAADIARLEFVGKVPGDNEPLKVIRSAGDKELAGKLTNLLELLRKKQENDTINSDVYSKLDGTLEDIEKGTFRGLFLPRGAQIELRNGVRVGEHHYIFFVGLSLKNSRMHRSISLYCDDYRCWLSSLVSRKDSQRVVLAKMIANMVFSAEQFLPQIELDKKVSSFTAVSRSHSKTSSNAVLFNLRKYDEPIAFNFEDSTSTVPNSDARVIAEFFSRLRDAREAGSYSGMRDFFADELGSEFARDLRYGWYSFSENRLSRFSLSPLEFGNLANNWTGIKFLGEISVEGGKFIFYMPLDNNGVTELNYLPVSTTVDSPRIEYEAIVSGQKYAVGNDLIMSEIARQLGVLVKLDDAAYSVSDTMKNRG